MSMKNICRLLAAAAALASLNSFADLVQPLSPLGDNSFSVSAGVTSGISGRRIGKEGGFGVGRVGAGFGFAKSAGYDLDYGLSIGGDWASPEYRIFTDE